MRVLTTSRGCRAKVDMQPEVAPLRKVTIVFGERLRWPDDGDDGDGDDGDDGDGGDDDDDDDDDAADGVVAASGAM